jgi:hypothetical protein
MGINTRWFFVGSIAWSEDRTNPGAHAHYVNLTFSIPTFSPKTVPTCTMQANSALTLLSTTLTSTVSPEAPTRRSAEDQLRQGESQPGFFLLVLELVRNDGDMVVRQAGGVYFKNAVRRLWGGDEVGRAGLHFHAPGLRYLCILFCEYCTLRF